MKIAACLIAICLAGAAHAESVTYSFNSAGFPRTGNFTTTGFDSTLGTLTRAVVDTSGSATFVLRSTNVYAPTIQYNLQSSQGIYQSNGPATYGGHGLSGSGTASYPNPNGPDFTYTVTLTGSGQRRYDLPGQFAQFIDTDLSAYFLTDNPFGIITYNGAPIGYELVSATAATRGTITYTYTPLSAGVPEPATWATMLAGLGAVGGAVRRNRRVRRPASAALPRS